TGDTKTTGHNYVATATVAPTCFGDQGYTIYTCTQCGESYTADYVAAYSTTGHSYDPETGTCKLCGTEAVLVIEDMTASNHILVENAILYADETVTLVLDGGASSDESYAARTASNLMNDIFMDDDGNVDFSTMTVTIGIDTADALAQSLGLTGDLTINLTPAVQNGDEIQLFSSNSASLTAAQLAQLLVEAEDATNQNIATGSYVACTTGTMTFINDLNYLSNLTGSSLSDFLSNYSDYVTVNTGTSGRTESGFTFYLAPGLVLKASYGDGSYLALADCVTSVTVTSDGDLDVMGMFS
ncbi:MAG: hypothetical protein LIO42_07290, partial [Oscillospiraceae bacterium]|nr:hypothetical protein [Oscillospiraceae bacterium]